MHCVHKGTWVQSVHDSGRSSDRKFQLLQSFLDSSSFQVTQTMVSVQKGRQTQMQAKIKLNPTKGSLSSYFKKVKLNPKLKRQKLQKGRHTKTTSDIKCQTHGK